MKPMPLYATTSELRNGVWDKRPLRAPAIPESVPESMSPLEEELESPPPTPRMDSPPRPSTPQAPTEKDDLQARPSCFSLFRYFISILLACLMTLLLVHINRPASHSASIIQNSPDIPSSQCISPSELSSRIEFAAATYETQSLSRHPVKTNSVSLVSLQTKFDTVMDSLDSYPVANNLVHTEVEMRDLSQRVKHSSLPNKDPLVEQLSLIASVTKDIVRSFQRLSSRVEGTWDQIVAINRYRLRKVEKVGNELIRGFNDGPDQFMPALFKSGTSELLEEVKSNVSDLNGLQSQLNFAHGRASQIQEDYNGRSVQHNWFTWLANLWTNDESLKDFDNNRELLQEIYAGLERALVQVKAELSLLHQISHDLHGIHVQLSAATLEVDSL